MKMNPTTYDLPADPQAPSSFCQAIVFFYACGCRAPEPVYCCQPVPGSGEADAAGVGGSGSGSNPCRHEKPELVVAKLPLACGSRIGGSAACGAEDPGAREFVREVDTAERLELVVLSDPAALPTSSSGDGAAAAVAVADALPAKVDGEFTVSQVVSGAKPARTKKFSPTAAPFVPGSWAGVSPPPPPPSAPVVAAEGGIDGAIRVEPAEESESLRDEPIPAKETACGEVVQAIEPKLELEPEHASEFEPYDIQSPQDEFIDVDLDDTESVFAFTAAELVPSITVPVEQEFSEKEPRPQARASMDEPEPPSFDQMMRSWTKEKQSAPKASRSCMGGISALFSMIGRRETFKAVQ
ncbi:hypothetical protein SAMD00023353_4900430 [Rosellinia necatrix]|uniref:Uncharacterized protein n=1 Tax=Rosellinia necatrix TaxID=77044 RepID=A0A1W2TPP7_ROSNE|nr:hypothetical protein SAMD00023353_4900430 [Rosellinia necatrix]